MNFKPLYDKMLIKAIAEASQTDTGIYMPDVAKDKPRRGKVAAVGTMSSKALAGKLVSGEDDKPLLKVGDIVYFAKYSGVEIDIEGETFLIMREEDIFGTVSE